jgi:hypothetical protein
MVDFFGWYEILTMCLIAGAYIHGSISGRAEHLELGVEYTLKALEEQGIIKVNENGEVEPVNSCK